VILFTILSAIVFIIVLSVTFLYRWLSPFFIQLQINKKTDIYLFRTTHHTKTQHVTKSRGRHCGDIQLVSYLANEVGPVPLVMDLHIVHDRFGSTSDPSLNGHLHYPNDIDK
jgi:hypothetical protein